MINPGAARELSRAFATGTGDIAEHPVRTTVDVTRVALLNILAGTLELPDYALWTPGDDPAAWAELLKKTRDRHRDAGVPHVPGIGEKINWTSALGRNNGLEFVATMSDRSVERHKLEEDRGRIVPVKPGDKIFNTAKEFLAPKGLVEAIGLLTVAKAALLGTKAMERSAEYQDAIVAAGAKADPQAERVNLRIELSDKLFPIIDEAFQDSPFASSRRDPESGLFEPVHLTHLAAIAVRHEPNDYLIGQYPG